METDYYKVLGVEKNASEEDIKKAYRKQAMKYHPDRQNGKSDSEKKEAESKFKQCSEAYETLVDKEKRSHYDRFGSTQGFQGGFGGHNFDPREFFRQHMGGFGGFGGFADFGDFGGFGNFGFDSGRDVAEDDPMSPKDGKNIRLQAKVSLEDMIYGSRKVFELDVTDPCEHCHGTGSEDGKLNKCHVCGGSGMVGQRHGMMFMQSTCPSCNGTGRCISSPCSVCHGSKTVSSHRRLEVDIPRGIQSGEEISICGKGIKGLNGGKDGDIRLTLIQDKHALFERDGFDLLTKITVPSIKAAIGGDIQVYTPWGMKTLHIPSGTSDKKAFKMEGYGVRTTRGNGNLYVVVNIETIENLSDSQRKILHELESTITEKNYKKTSENIKKFEEFEKNAKMLRDT